MSDLAALLSRPQRLRIVWLLVGMVFAALLEMVGIAAIPGFVALLLEPQRMVARLPQWSFTADLAAYDHLSVMTLSATVLAAFFLRKNLFVAGLALLEGHGVRSKWELLHPEFPV